MTRLITDLLLEHGILESLIQNFKLFTEYFSNQCTIYNGHTRTTTSVNVLQILEKFNIQIILTELHFWADRTGGIQYSTQLFVIKSGKLYKGREIVFRHQTDPKKDRPDLAMGKIMDAKLEENKITVKLSTREKEKYIQSVYF